MMLFIISKKLIRRSYISEYLDYLFCHGPIFSKEGRSTIKRLDRLVEVSFIDKGIPHIG